MILQLPPIVFIVFMFIHEYMHIGLVPRAGRLVPHAGRLWVAIYVALGALSPACRSCRSCQRVSDICRRLSELSE